jgi:CheY-like chemotaxis protein
MAKVLIADDSDLDRELTARALRKAAPEFQTVLSEDGEEALRRFEAEPEVVLVLLDHRMPKMGAEDFLAAIPADRKADVAIILFSSAVSPTNVDRCLQLGARAYVEKPTDPMEYSAAVKKVVREYLTAEGRGD